MNELNVPPSVEADAKNRAWRTLLQSLGVDVAAAIVLAVTPLLASIEFTAPYWAAVGLLAARSAITALVSWVARKVVPPTP